MNLFESAFSQLFQKELADGFETISVEKGEVIVREGDLMRKIPFLKEGLIKVFKEDLELDREVLLYYVYPGQTCMMSLIAGLKDSRSLVGARLENDSEIILIPTERIKTWQLNYPEFTRFILETFIARYFELIDTISALTFENIEIRIVKLLSARAKGSPVRTIRMTHKEIAQILGTTRVVVSRILKKMERENKIRLGRGSIEPIDLSSPTRF
jgi:CRP/FNR family transcriptional regulator